MPNLTRWTKTAIAIVFAITVCLGFNYFWCYANLWPDAYLLPEAISPRYIGSAVFISDGGSFAGKSLWVYARDPSTVAGKPQLLGGPYASDGDVKMVRAVWSRDGTLLAVQARVGQSAGHRFVRYDGKFFVSGYDYQEHRILSEGSSYKARSTMISHLFAMRGGMGTQALTMPYAADEKPLNNSEGKMFARK